MPSNTCPHSCVSVIALALAALATNSATAATIDADSATPTGWRLQVTPYVWAVGLKSTLQLSPQWPAVQANQSFSEVLSDLKAAAFLNATARYGRYVLQGDASYASLSHRALLPPGLPVRAKLQQSALTLTGGYQWPLSERDQVDLLAGVRAWHVRAQVQAAPLLDQRWSQSWVDPIVAVRWRHAWAQRWSSLVYADVGGWNVGAKRTWQALATVNYQFSEQLYVSAGYRHLYVDYRDGPVRVAAHLGGPLLGATWRF